MAHNQADDDVENSWEMHLLYICCVQALSEALRQIMQGPYFVQVTVWWETHNQTQVSVEHD
jgi:hypothetical protein